MPHLEDTDKLNPENAAKCRKSEGKREKIKHQLDLS